MSDDALKAHIAELKKVMENSLSGGEKDLLGHIVANMMDGAEHLDDSEREAIGDQVDEAVVEFEVKHPRVANTLREVSDILSKMGI